MAANMDQKSAAMIAPYTQSFAQKGHEARAEFENEPTPRE